MPRAWWYKFLLFSFTMMIAGLHVLPSMFPAVDVKKFPVKQRINLGLDLQGGLYLTLGIHFPDVYAETLARNSKLIEADFKKAGIPIRSVTKKEGANENDPQMIFDIEDPAKVEDFRAKLKKEWGEVLRITDQNGGKVEVGFTPAQFAYINEKTTAQSIEVIRNRIDEFGVSEPVITSHGKDKVLIELPGVKDVDRAKNLIGQTAKLEFKIVADEKMSPTKLQGIIDSVVAAHKAEFPDDLKLSDYVRKINGYAKDQIPAGTEIAFERIMDPVTKTIKGKIPYLLDMQVEVTGEDLQDAFVSVDQQKNMPFVSLSFNFRGAEKFERVTGANVKKRLAIVLDGVVHSAPVLQERIGGGKAQITMGQRNYQEVLKEATDLSIVLRAGALPARLEFEEQRIVGPSLGADSIASGKFASYIAFAFIAAFMLLYYRGSGAIAIIALIFNTIYIFAFLVGFEATLTLPGIAGIALTLGMAVDANIVIYERIREEIKAGKSPAAAIHLGFEKASASIVDSNLTTAIAGLVLMEFGSGPVRGFAVTLLIGIATTLFTAVFVSRLFFDLFFLRPGKVKATISI